MLPGSLAQFRGYRRRLLVSKAFGRVRRAARRELQRLSDQLRSSYADDAETLRPLPLPVSAGDVPDDLCAYLVAVAPAYLEHRFNVLGSGWVQVVHGVTCAGLDGRSFPPGPSVSADRAGDWLVGRINRANLAESKEVWRLIERDDYVPIDWQLDFKSGYRWSERCYHSETRIGPAPGADIKLPRELARMQHLPQLALCALCAAAGDRRFARVDTYLGEIRAQLLDFIATNPPRFGANWACTMDVAIRVANWLLTLDLLAAAELSLDTAAHAVIARSVADHADYTAGHLEWSESHRTNHYLADVVGLLYAAGRLGPSPRNDAWLAFAVREVMAEAEVQFHPEGTCYEGSTNYHRLSAELLLFGTALAAGLPEDRWNALDRYSPAAIRVRPPFLPPPVARYPDATGRLAPVPPEVADRLWRAARFSTAVTRPDGRVAQIGDTDSGRLFWLHPVAASGEPPARDDLDHGALVEAVEGLFARPATPRWLDTAVVRSLGGTWRPNPPAAAPVPADSGDPDEIEALLRALPEAQRRLRRYPLVAGTWTREAFPAFGLYLFRRERDFIALRCAGAVASGTPTGHLHDDNLGLELMLDCRPLITDPGTYVYTGDPAARNRYREAAAHDAPRAKGWAVASPTMALFSLAPRAYAECLCWRPNAVAGRIAAPEGTLYRLLRLRKDALEIWDGVSVGELAPLSDPLPLCEGYGRPT